MIAYGKVFPLIALSIKLIIIKKSMMEKESEYYWLDQVTRVSKKFEYTNV